MSQEVATSSSAYNASMLSDQTAMSFVAVNKVTILFIASFSAVGTLMNAYNYGSLEWEKWSLDLIYIPKSNRRGVSILRWEE